MVDAVILTEQCRQFLKLPNMIGQPGLHGWRNSQRPVNPAVVVVHEVQRDVVGVILSSTFAVFNRHFL